MSKRIISLILVGLMIFYLTGCGSKVEKIMNVLLEDETTVSTEGGQETNTIEDNVVEDSKNNTNIENDVEEKNGEAVEDIEEGTTFLTMVYDESGKSPEDMALAFLRYIRNEEYDKLVPLMVGTDGKYVTGEDIYNVMFRNASEFLEITDKDCLVETNVDVEKGEGVVYIGLSDIESEKNLNYFTVPIILNDENLCQVNLIEEYAAETLHIVIPENCELSIAGIPVIRDVDAVVRPYVDDANKEVWEVKYVGIGKKDCNVKSSVFDVTTQIEIPDDSYTNSKDFILTLEVDPVISEKAREYIKTMLQTLLVDATKGTLTLEQAKTYVSESADDTLAGEFYQSMLKAIDPSFGDNYSNIVITDVIDHPTDLDVWYTDKCLEISVGVSATWEHKAFNEFEDMDKYTYFALEYVNGEFKIADILQSYTWDMGYLNDYSHDY